MDWLSRRVNIAADKGDIRAYDTIKRADKIHHLLFADDILIFSKDCPTSTANLLKILDEFCEISGEVLNPNKSLIFFSKHIDNARKEMILSMTKFKESQLPTRYLGAPLIQGRVKIQYFSYILESLENRISGWMRNLLSMAGRIALIQSVLSSLSIHVMSILPIPKMVLKQIQSLIANFLWDQGAQKKKHWVSTEKVCSPKGEGGLGITNLMDSMKALHGKLAWKFMEQNSLWARFAKSRFTIGKSGSPIWNTIGKHIDYLRDKSYWEVGKGDEGIAKFLWHMNRPYNSEFARLTIKEVLGRRPLRLKFLCMVPEEAANYYKNADFTSDEGKLRWLESTDGTFSSKKYLQVRRHAKPKCEWGNTIWQQWLPPRFSLHTWKILHNGLPTDDNIRKLGINIASRCICCLKEEESLHHLFFEGDWANGFWTFMEEIFEHQRPRLVGNLIDNWINPYRKKEALSNLRLGMICVGLHYIWKLRNSAKHDEPHPFDPNELIRWAGYLVNLIPKGGADNRKFRKIQILLRIPFNIRSTIEGRWAIWEPDRQGFTMDVAISEECKNTAILIRDNRGGFVRADKQSVDSTHGDNDLRRIIDKWKEGAGDKISTIYYAHHFSYPKRGAVSLKKVHPLVIRGAMSLCFNASMNGPIVNMWQLPRSTQMILSQDNAKLHIFCSSDDEENAQQQIESSMDDNSFRRPYLASHVFADDTRC